MITIISLNLFIVLLFMFFLWIIYAISKKANIVDIGWTLSFLICMWVAFFIGEGYLLKRIILAFMVSIWSVRLAWHLFQRFLNDPEDPRYTDMRERWGTDPQNIKFLMMFLFQGIIAVVLALPFYLVAVDNVSDEWATTVFVGIIIWAIGLAGEAIADQQLANFKQNPGEKKVCDVGLWRYSRHPNYFFEFLIWVGYAVFAWSSPWGSLAIASPLIILYLLVYVSGIPLLEEKSLENKGDEYREYQRRTSAFIPWFPG